MVGRNMFNHHPLLLCLSYVYCISYRTRAILYCHNEIKDHKYVQIKIDTWVLHSNKVPGKSSLWRPILWSKLPLQGKVSYCKKAFCKTMRFPHVSGARPCPLFLDYYCPLLVILRSGSFTLCCKPTAPLCAPETDRNVSLPVLIVAWSLATREGHTQPHSLFPE